jgi:hypothetical protein
MIEGLEISDVAIKGKNSMHFTKIYCLIRKHRPDRDLLHSRWIDHGLSSRCPQSLSMVVGRLVRVPRHASNRSADSGIVATNRQISS